MLKYGLAIHLREQLLSRPLTYSPCREKWERDSWVGKTSRALTYAGPKISTLWAGSLWIQVTPSISRVIDRKPAKCSRVRIHVSPRVVDVKATRHVYLHFFPSRSLKDLDFVLRLLLLSSRRVLKTDNRHKRYLTTGSWVFSVRQLPPGRLGSGLNYGIVPTTRSVESGSKIAQAIFPDFSWLKQDYLYASGWADELTIQVPILRLGTYLVITTFFFTRCMWWYRRGRTFATAEIILRTVVTSKWAHGVR